MPIRIDPEPLQQGTKYGDFRDQLVNDGFAVVPNVIPEGKAAEYVQQCYDWLESFELGFKRDDPSTFKPENLPVNSKGGLYNKYGVAWIPPIVSIRQEPDLVEVFAKIWGTDQLLVSFDGANISVPLGKNANPNIHEAWPHVDQSPLRTHMHCIQGIMNLAPNSPDDGGLMVLRGSKSLYADLFKEFEKDMPEGGWSEEDGYGFTEEMMQWFYDRGCQWEKVCAGPGDVILWDSRTCHYGAPPKANNPRIATYVCYKPAAWCTPEAVAERRYARENMRNTVHDPCYPDMVDNSPPTRDGKPDPAWAKMQVPPNKPVFNELGRKLHGVESY